MSDVPVELKYTESHEWILDNDDGTYTVGITDHAQSLLGELVFVETPEVGDTKSIGDDTAVVESVKTASDVYSPLDGEIIEANESLNDSPNLVNDSPYVDGWLFKIKSNNAALGELMDADKYKEHIA